jgi:hypothetical protein
VDNALSTNTDNKEPNGTGRTDGSRISTLVGDDEGDGDGDGAAFVVDVDDDDDVVGGVGLAQDGSKVSRSI